MDIELHNHREVERLNQRGGRTLTVVDLIRAGTLSVPMAACAMRAMAGGASLLTGARPGGAGKTTLLASILHLLPPGVRIVTVDKPRRLAEAAAGGEPESTCHLVHEIGDGHWYGYLWGPEVAEFFALIGGRQCVASCLHADTLEELTAILTSRPLGVPRAAIGRVGLILFMHVSRTRAGYQRRVSAFYEADGRGERRLLFRWDPATDAFEAAGRPLDPQGLSPYADFLARLVEEGASDADSVRRKVLSFYAQQQR